MNVFPYGEGLQKQELAQNLGEEQANISAATKFKGVLEGLLLETQLTKVPTDSSYTFWRRLIQRTK